eukprot:CAMPEP_0182434008 /NCGR_PEP_ID=MMETSP1167-20130531/67004_1 /TAXON_ID=2988 /ORGANISM="Mallomonas Sp, Strain CCMP3275" /LENGTH=43 /DNA_ID= /DNA_START= /DNA_END= /DNA_ORIENTATION=
MIPDIQHLVEHMQYLDSNETAYNELHLLSTQYDLNHDDKYLYE